MEVLWAPWRETFITQPKPKRRPCIFCAAGRSQNDPEHQVIFRGRTVFALLNRYPYNNGHIMVAPYRHIGDFESFSQAEWNEALKASQKLLARLRRLLHPQGFNIGLNLGRVAGAGFPGHLHLHLVPRWDGDTNFMPILAQTKVISQSLDSLYHKLHL